jgi:DNA modification methylase
LEDTEHSSTVGRGKNKSIVSKDYPKKVIIGSAELNFGNSLDLYEEWEKPDTIISDGGYGILGFKGDVSKNSSLIDWYEPHIEFWTQATNTTATLWFWNSEHGWASIHNTLVNHGWKYLSCNVWNKGTAHIAGNVNTKKMKFFPKVTEVCVQYVKEPQFNNLTMQKWLFNEWKKTGLPLSAANEACEVADAAGRKYLNQGHLFYPPPPEKFEKLVSYANKYGVQKNAPYFSIDKVKPLTPKEWQKYLPFFKCPLGWTNVWTRNPLKGAERIKAPNKKVAHLNQKPYDLTKLILEASTPPGGVVWEPFGGLFTSSLVSMDLNFRSYAAEIDRDYYNLGVERLYNNSKN